jgi:ribonuclease HII
MMTAPRADVAADPPLRSERRLINQRSESSRPRSAAEQVAGVDEVGRGCLFGPVLAAAVVLPSTATAVLERAGVTDSKKLSARRRAALVPLIQRHASSWGLGQASAAEVDNRGIRTATELAMLRALQKLSTPPELVLVDGVLPLRPWTGEQQTIVGGDARCLAIAAASVLAKEARDALIRRLAERFPGYGLERHVGYGTVQHRQALITMGPTVLHRRSFLRRLEVSAGGTNHGNHPPTAGSPSS